MNDVSAFEKKLLKQPSINFLAVIDTLAAHIDKHRKWYIAAFLVYVIAEGLRVSLRGKFGDFAPVVEALQRFWLGAPLYVKEPGKLAYIYSPLFAVVFSPLGALPPALACFLWFIFYWLLAVGSLRLSKRIILGCGARIRSSNTVYWLLCVVPVVYFLYYNGLNGQATMLMMYLALLSYHLDLSGRSALAGIPLAASILIKPFPIIFIPFYAIRRQWLVILSTCVSIAVGIIVPMLIFGSGYGGTLRSWIQVTKLQQEDFGVNEWGIQSVWAFWNRIFQRWDAPLLPLPPRHIADWLILATSFLLVLFPLSLLSRTHSSSSGAKRNPSSLGAQHISFGLLMICWAILPPTGWKHYFVLLVFPCSLLAAIASKRLWATASPRPAIAAIAFLSASELFLHVKAPACPRFPYWICWCLIMALVVMAVLLRYAVASLREPRQLDETDPLPPLP